MGTSLNGVVVYKSRYGSTRQYGEWISKALRIPMIDPERLDQPILSFCDFLLVGTPVYKGKMLISDWLQDNKKLLTETKLFLFVVCTHFDDIEKQQAMIKDNIPESLLSSCVISFLPGKLAVDTLTKEDSLYLNLSAQTQGESIQKDIVQESSIGPLLETIKIFLAEAEPANTR